MTTTQITWPTPTAAQIAQADMLDQAAAHAAKIAQESWDRSDTDGFLSQWAGDLSARKNRLQAKILREQGGYAEFSALFDAETGEHLAQAFEFSGRYGTSWRVPERACFFSPSRAQNDERRIAANRRKGFYVGTVLAPAKADIAGSGTGLSGCASAHIAVVRTTQGADGVIVIDNGQE